MLMTKFTHACVRFEDGDRALVVDPGVFSEAAQALDGASGVLITHEHADHLDPEALRAAARADAALRIWAPEPVAAQLADLGEQVMAVGPGESFDAAGFAVTTFGGQHALIHPLIPMCANVGYLIDGAVYHPGDSFVVPPAPVALLLVPSSAPWSKLSEVIDFVLAVRAPRAVQIHDALLSAIGTTVVERNLGTIAAGYDVEFSHLDPLAQVSV